MNRKLCLTLSVFTGAVAALAQPGPLTTLRNSNLIFAASTLLTNGLPGLTNPAPKLMVNAVQTNSAQGGRVALVVTQMWSARYNGPITNEDQALRVVADGEGNIIVAGYSRGSSSSPDATTIKYSPTGVALWTNRYDGLAHGDDRAELVAVDGSNNVYVCGLSAALGGGRDIVTIKYSPNGMPLWTNFYIGPPSGFLFLAGMEVDPEGNVYILPSDFDLEAFVIEKYDNSGNLAWTRFFKASASSEDSAYDLVVDAAGNLFVTGNSFGSFTGNQIMTLKCSSDGTGLWTNFYSLDGSGTGTDLAVDRQGDLIVLGDIHSISNDKYPCVKYSSSGTALWTNVLNAPSHAGGGVPALAVDPFGNVFITGGTPGGGSTVADFITVKFSSAGTALWTNRFVYPSSTGPWLHGTAVDNAGNFYLACESSPIGNYDMASFKCSAGGLPVWTNRYNGPANNNDLPRHMTVDKAGNVCVVGTTAGLSGSFSSLDFATVKYRDNVRYTPPTNFVGLDSFSFIVVDHLGNTGTGTVTIAVLPLTLQLNTSTTNFQLTSQGMRLQVDGARGTNPVILLVSSNLSAWEPIHTSAPVLGSASYVDSAATNLSRRYYRARQLQ